MQREPATFSCADYQTYGEDNYVKRIIDIS